MKTPKMIGARPHLAGGFKKVRVYKRALHGGTVKAAAVKLLAARGILIYNFGDEEKFR